jgi:hypothetical protein
MRACSARLRQVGGNAAIAVAMLLGLASASHGQAAKNEVSINEQAAQALWWGDFDELERMHALYLQPGQRAADGNPHLTAFRHGIKRVLKGKKNAPEAYFVEQEALTRQWAIEHPKSALAHAMYAAALAAHGWSYRGTDYAKTVPPEAWESFRSYIQKAINYMSANAEVAFTSSVSHRWMIGFARAAGWDADKILAIAKDGLRVNPEDDGIYFEVAFSLLPKWGGSAAALDRFIQEVVARTESQRGLEMYARLYADAAAEEFEHRLFDESAARWPKMKQGFEDLLKRYPDPVNVNRFAYFACLAKDQPTALDLLEQVGAKPIVAEWGDNGTRSYEACKRWAAAQ